MPSQVCVSKQKIYDSLGASASNVLRAAVVKIAGNLTPIAGIRLYFHFKLGSPCLTCYLSAGRIHVYSLPSLRELFTTNLDVVLDTHR